MTRKLIPALALALLVAGALVWSPWAVGEVPALGTWSRVPDAPLSPREGAVGVWTGQEALVIGGSDARPCHPSGSCRPARIPPLRDGAAYNPVTRSWRRIAPAPVGMTFAHGARVGRTFYLAVARSRGRPGAPKALLSYDLARDRWRSRPPPPGQAHALVAAGRRLVSIWGSRLFVLGPRARVWEPLPRPPLTRGFSQQIIWNRGRLLLFDHERTRNPPGDLPLRVSSLDLDSRRWRRLPDDRASRGHIVQIDGRILTLNTEGGVLDADRGGFMRFPAPPEQQEGDELFGADWLSGVITESGGHWFGGNGWILDMRDGSWSMMRQLGNRGPRSLVQGRTEVAMGDRGVLAFGGARWGRRFSYTLMRRAWAWAP